MLRLGRVVVTVDLSVNSVRSTYSRRRLQAVGKVRHPGNRVALLPELDLKFRELRLPCRRNPRARQIRFRSVLLSCLAFRRGLAISRQPILRRG